MTDPNLGKIEIDESYLTVKTYQFSMITSPVVTFQAEEIIDGIIPCVEADDEDFRNDLAFKVPNWFCLDSKKFKF